MQSILRELVQHSPTDIIGMGVSFIRTKLFYSRAQLIRRPFHLRGKKSNLQLSEGFTTGRNCRFELYEDGIISFGANCHIGDNVHIASSGRVDIGDNALFASKIYISDTSHGSYGKDGDSPDTPPDDRPLVHSSVKIGKNVWLGENVVVLAGVTIGDGCIIGANATVSKDIPADCIAVGSPAHPIKQYDRNKGEWVKCDSVS